MKWTMVLLALAAFTGDTARVKKMKSNDAVIQQERMDTQKTLMKQTNSTADQQPALVSQTVTGNWGVNKWYRTGGNWTSSGKMALYINADLGNIRLDISTDTQKDWETFSGRDFKTEMSRHETSHLLSQHDKKIYKLKREYYSNGTEIDVFESEHATTLSYDCEVAELPDAESSKYMGCVREQFSKRWFLDQYELKDSWTRKSSNEGLDFLDRYHKSNYGVHVSDEGGITEIDMSETVSNFAFAENGQTGSWKTEYSLGNPEAKYPTVFDASVFKPDKAPAAKDRFRQRINLDCQKMDPNGLIPLHMSKSLIECLTR